MVSDTGKPNDLLTEDNEKTRTGPIDRDPLNSGFNYEKSEDEEEYAEGVPIETKYLPDWNATFFENEANVSSVIIHDDFEGVTSI